MKKSLKKDNYFDHVKQNNIDYDCMFTFRDKFTLTYLKASYHKDDKEISKYYSASKFI